VEWVNVWQCREKEKASYGGFTGSWGFERRERALGEEGNNY